MTDVLYAQKHRVDTAKGRIDVPMWALSHLGKRVTLSTAWHTGQKIFRAGDTATLDGITHRKDGTNRGLLIFDNDPLEDLVDIPFSHIETPPIPLDLVRSIPGRAGELAFMWLNGIDVRNRVSKASFYRYRNELLQYSIDILKPFVFKKPAPRAT